MQFQPKTEKEIAEGKLLPKGEYDFEIIDATEKTSAAGNDMIELTLRVSNGDGMARVLTDYLLPKRAGKLRNCCAACGVLQKYESGVVSDDDFPVSAVGSSWGSKRKTAGQIAMSLLTTWRRNYVLPCPPAITSAMSTIATKSSRPRRTPAKRQLTVELAEEEPSVA